MRRFDPGIGFARDFVREEIGELIALKAWYCDSAYRYPMTDTLQPLPRSSANARKPPGDPKGDRRRYYLIGHGSHLVDTARFLVGEEIVTRAAPSLPSARGAHCWFVSVEFADGSIGHLDLTISVQMDWHEGFHIYGEHGSVTAKSFLPWYRRASEVECFSARDRQYHRPLGEDAHFWRRQVEGFADSDPQRRPAARRERRRRPRRDASDGRDRALGRDRARPWRSTEPSRRRDATRHLRQDVQPLARSDETLDAVAAHGIDAIQFNMARHRRAVAAGRDPTGAGCARSAPRSPPAA